MRHSGNLRYPFSLGEVLSAETSFLNGTEDRPSVPAAIDRLFGTCDSPTDD